MILTSEKALELLEQAKGMAPDDNWILHSICVGDTASKIAEALNLDVNVAKTLGYIHDIGKRFGFGNESMPHPIKGYEYILELGYDEEYASVCLTHSYLNNDINCVAGGIPSKERYRYDFTKDFVKNHKYTVYEKLINLCDLMCTTKRMTLEQRIIEIMLRRGVYDNTVYHITEAKKLKKEIDEMLGYSVYTLFEDIKLDV